MPRVDYRKVLAAWTSQIRDDLSGLLGGEVHLKGPNLEIVDTEGAAGDNDPIAHCPATSKSDPGHKVVFALPMPDAVTLAALLMGFDGNLIDEKRKEPLDEELLDAFGEVMNLSNAAWSRVLEGEGLGATSRGTPDQNPSPGLDTTWLGDGWFRRARWTIDVNGERPGCFDLLIPRDTHEAWFGEGFAVPGEEPEEDHPEVQRAASGAASEDATDPDAAPGALVFVSADEADREGAEALEPLLGVPVVTVAPPQLESDMFEELAESSAVVLDWDLGVCTGLDALFTLRRHATTRHVPVALASARPTRGMVTTAIREGARTFLRKPWNLEEVAGRLLPAGYELPSQQGEDEAAAAEAGPASAGDQPGGAGNEALVET